MQGCKFKSDNFFLNFTVGKNNNFVIDIKKKKKTMNHKLNN